MNPPDTADETRRVRNTAGPRGATPVKLPVAHRGGTPRRHGVKGRPSTQRRPVDTHLGEKLVGRLVDDRRKNLDVPSP